MKEYIRILKQTGDKIEMLVRKVVFDENNGWHIDTNRSVHDFVDDCFDLMRNLYILTYVETKTTSIIFKFEDGELYNAIESLESNITGLQSYYDEDNTVISVDLALLMVHLYNILNFCKMEIKLLGWKHKNMTVDNNDNNDITTDSTQTFDPTSTRFPLPEEKDEITVVGCTGDE